MAVVLGLAGCQGYGSPRSLSRTTAAADEEGPGIPEPEDEPSSSRAPFAQDPRLVPAVQAYAAYVTAQAATLPARTRPFTDAIRAGDVAAAKQRYAAGRVAWERIQSVAAYLPALDRRLDARADDFATPADRSWTGWHRLERLLWTTNSTAGGRPLADQLDRDVRELSRAVATLSYTPDTMAAGIERLVEEAIQEKLPGAEDVYSRADLADLAGNIEGARAGYGFVRPIVLLHHPALAAALDDRFDAVARTLARYRTAAGYRPSTALSAADHALLQSRLSSLAESLTNLSAALTGP
jgi:iron uptake system component EfeO